MLARLGELKLTAWCESAKRQAWDFAVKERTRPLQQYVAAFPKKGAYYGRVHSLHAVVGQEGPLAVVR